MNTSNKKYIKLLLIGFIGGFILALSIFYIITRLGGTGGNPFSADDRLSTTKYTFIKPILNSGYGNEDESLKWFPAERKLKRSVEDIVAEKSDIDTGVFFLNLKNSGWFSVNPSTTYIPASLLKLPTLISYFKLHEADKDLFEKQIAYEGKDFNALRTIGASTITPGKTYTVKELMNEMIINSDNNALQLLYQYRKNSLVSIFTDLAIPLPSTDDEIANKDFVTTRDIARFLLVLYNASYLSAEDSEQALQILSKTSFKDGLVAGVPPTIVVSHKFGEREQLLPDKSIKVELHDCGIVYHPQTPYIVCIMTKGKNIDSQKNQIQKISKIIYESVNTFSNKESQ